MANPKNKRGSKKVCQVTGKRPCMGGKIVHRGISKKAGGIGLQKVKEIKRKFRPNLQKIRVQLITGEVKKLWISAKAIKAGLVLKVVKTKRSAGGTVA